MSAKNFALENGGMRYSIATDNCRGAVVSGRTITVRVVGYVEAGYLIAEIPEGDASKFKEEHVWSRVKLEGLDFKSVADPVTDANVLIATQCIDTMTQIPSSSLLTDVEEEAEAE